MAGLFDPSTTGNPTSFGAWSNPIGPSNNGFSSSPSLSTMAGWGATPNWEIGDIGSAAPAAPAAAANPASAAVVPPTASAAGTNLGQSTPLGMNVGTGQLAVSGLTALGNLWTAWNATQLAKESFNFNKQLSQANYTNQSTAYNTNLENIATSRGVMENKSAADTNSYIDSHKVKTTVG